MSFIQNFFTSRDNQTDGNTYVGQEGRLWYNPLTNSIYVNTANIAGGTPVALATGANITANIITVNTITSTSGNIAVTGNLVISGNISPAAEDKIGGIFPGPGVVISNQGELTIDTANLPLSFGNFTASNNVLSITNVDEDMILQTEGSAEIQLVGNIGFYKPDGIPPNVANRYAFFNNDGQATFYVPTSDPAAGAFRIVGSTSALVSPPLNTGVMLHITGQNDDASRFYNDSIGSFAAFVGRRINGNVLSPTAVQAGDEIIRISSTGYDGNSIPGGAGARIVFQAMENFTPTARGSNLSLWATAVGSNTLTKIVTVDVANGVNATKFTTAGTVSATGNITGGNVVTLGNVNANYVNVTQDIQTNYLFASANIGGGNVILTGTFYGASTSVVGNVISGNVNTTNISLTGNVIGNVVTAGLVSATGNITGGNIRTAGLISATGGITSADGITATGNLTVSGNIGYTVATNNATVTQLTSKATAVTCNGRTGQITTSNSSLAKGAAVTFTVNNNYITAITDVPVVAFQNGATIDSYAVSVTRVQVGSFNITITNNGVGALTDTIIINFAVIKVA